MYLLVQQTLSPIEEEKVESTEDKEWERINETDLESYHTTQSSLFSSVGTGQGLESPFGKSEKVTHTAIDIHKGIYQIQCDSFIGREGLDNSQK